MLVVGLDESVGKKVVVRLEEIGLQDVVLFYTCGGALRNLDNHLTHYPVPYLLQ